MDVGDFPEGETFHVFEHKFRYQRSSTPPKGYELDIREFARAERERITALKSDNEVADDELEEYSEEVEDLDQHNAKSSLNDTDTSTSATR